MHRLVFAALLLSNTASARRASPSPQVRSITATDARTIVIQGSHVEDVRIEGRPVRTQRRDDGSLVMRWPRGRGCEELELGYESTIRPRAPGAASTTSWRSVRATYCHPDHEAPELRVLGVYPGTTIGTEATRVVVEVGGAIPGLHVRVHVGGTTGQLGWRERRGDDWVGAVLLEVGGGGDVLPIRVERGPLMAPRATTLGGSHVLVARAEVEGPTLQRVAAETTTPHAPLRVRGLDRIGVGTMRVRGVLHGEVTITIGGLVRPILRREEDGVVVFVVEPPDVGERVQVRVLRGPETEGRRVVVRRGR